MKRAAVEGGRRKRGEEEVDNDEVRHRVASKL